MGLDLRVLTDEFKQALGSIEENLTPAVSAGRVIACADGVVTVQGLPAVRCGELILLGEHAHALVMNLEEDCVGAILLSDADEVSQGDIARCTGKIIGVPCGDTLLGRVIDPLGNPLDGKGALHADTERPIEFPAPDVFGRKKVSRPLFTGITAIDSMIPIGRGQRELIIGDRQTGKTTVAVDAILSQKGKGVACVYVAIGQKLSTVRQIIDTLAAHGALSYTTVVCSTAGQSAPMQYIAPYTGTAVAEHFCYTGRDALIVYDDLSKHAVAYRAISLLLGRPSGREAYPGDIFYIHSRLLERAAQLSDALGGGSLTALPIVETLGGDISAYVPTNIISITDGQIYLESELFHSGVRPAVNVGLSGSRVGGSAQYPAIRAVSGKIRLELAHYREIAQFSQFGADLEAGAKATLLRGERLTEMLKQNEHSPRSVCKMATELMLMSENKLGSVAPADVRAVLDAFCDRFEDTNAALVDAIEQSGQMTDAQKAQILSAFDSYGVTQ